MQDERAILCLHPRERAKRNAVCGVTKPLGGDIEAEFTKLIDAEAQATRKAGERPATAFDRYFIVATASYLLSCSAQLEAWRHFEAIASI